VEREFHGGLTVSSVGAALPGWLPLVAIKRSRRKPAKMSKRCVWRRVPKSGAPHPLCANEPRAWKELFPDWKELRAPLNTPSLR